MVDGITDPMREAQKLREHLSSFDAPISFLFGAGASASVDVEGKPLVPSVSELTNQCRSAVAENGAWAEAVWDGIRDDIERRRGQGPPVTVEDILTAIRDKQNAMSPSDTSLGATVDQLATLEQVISACVASAASLDAQAIPTDLPHHAFARWIERLQRANPVEIFTTNYDTLIETALEDLRVPVFDGFVGSARPFFWPASLAHSDDAPGKNWTRLWKLHGSVNWELTHDPGGGARIVRGSAVENPHLILPSLQKYDQSRKLPYIAMLDRLARTLTQRERGILVVVGFSFGDQHINEVILDALDVNDRVHVVALQYADPVEGDPLWRMATRSSNMLVYGPTLAIIDGAPTKWKLLEPAVDESAIMIDPVFDSFAAPEDDTQELEGRFRLGDFRWFARFLDAIAVPRG